MVPTALPGGFIGVDIFFVISGYLITQTLWSDIERDKFSLTRFYERRIRRIVPALTAMLVVTFIAAFTILMPFDFKGFCASLTATVLFASNFYFWWKAGYFDQAAVLKPLLHTWSLAVEEQYYTFFPLLLYALRGFRRRTILLIIAAISLVSFAAAIVMVVKWPTAAFYLPIGRFWELLAGASAALALQLAPKHQRMRELMGAAGLILLAAAIALMNEKRPFPGLLAVPPVVGTALIIVSATRGQTIVSRALSNPVLTWFGGISYSLYLWHWPILSLFRYVMRRGPEGWELLAFLAVSIALAWISTTFIEAPFRTGVFKTASRKSLFTGAALASGAMAACAFAGLALHGMPGRYKPLTRAFAQAAYDINPMRARCDRRSASAIAADQYCVVGATDAPAPTFAFLGDSFGDALVPGIENAARADGEKGAILTFSGCYPLLGLNQQNGCRGFWDSAVSAIDRQKSIRTVVLVARWTAAYSGTRFGEASRGGWYLTDDDSKGERSYPETRRVFVRAIDRTLTRLKGYNVVVLMGIPEQDRDVPRAEALASQFGQPLFAGISRDTHEARQADLRAVWVEKARQYHVRLVDLTDRLCDAQTCHAIEDGKVLYADDNHLSRTGALAISGVLKMALADPAADHEHDVDYASTPLPAPQTLPALRSHPLRALALRPEAGSGAEHAPSRDKLRRALTRAPETPVTILTQDTLPTPSMRRATLAGEP